MDASKAPASAHPMGKPTPPVVQTEQVGLPKPNWLEVLKTLLIRELQLAARQKSEVLSPLFFYLVVASLFPLAVGPESQLLTRMGAGVVWVGALLSIMLGLPRLFATDHQDGSLERQALSPTPLVLLVHAKVAAHMLLAGLPLCLAAPVLGLQYGLPPSSLWVLVGSLLLGIPSLCMIGAIGAALTLGLRGGGVLLSLLCLPLFIPVLIFGAGAVESFQAGLGASAHLSLLVAMAVVAVFFAPFGIAAALRLALES